MAGVVGCGPLLGCLLCAKATPLPVQSRARRVIDGEFGNVGGVAASTQKDGFMDAK